LDLAGIFAPGEALMAVKEQLRAIPNRGLGYGLLRYLCADQTVRAQLQQRPQAQLNFNYLGQFDQPAEALAAETRPPSHNRPLAESTGPTQNPAGRRPYLLEIVGSVTAGVLSLDWIYSQQVHEHATIAWLAERYLAALRQLIEHCQSPEAGGVTPSDFSLLSLDQQSLAKILGNVKVVKE
jgi:non-ribosomal peptide synthase protein (TIGR01720 family)